jgi:hypothetical protein
MKFITVLWRHRQRVRRNLSDVQERAAKAALYPSRRHWRRRV